MPTGVLALLSAGVSSRLVRTTPFAASVTLTQTINSALLLSAGAYYVFTNEGIPAQNESFPYPSLGGAVYQAGDVMVHGTVGSLTLVVAPVSYTGGSSGMPANLFVPAGTNIGTHVKGAAGDAAACCTVGCGVTGTAGGGVVAGGATSGDGGAMLTTVSGAARTATAASTRIQAG